MTSTTGDTEEMAARYGDVAARFGPALARLATGYEADAARREDLIQDIHVRLWQSLERFDGRCSLRTWVYRVAHNVAADHVAREKRWHGMIDLDDAGVAETVGGPADPESETADRMTLDTLHRLVRRLKPLDRQVMLLYLEEEAAETIAGVTGLSSGAVATRIHRIKSLLAERFNQGGLT